MVTDLMHGEKWALILNPQAGSGKGAEDKDTIVGLLQQHGFNFSLHTSVYPGHLAKITIEAIKKGYRKIISAGGDGTINEIVNGIFAQKVVEPSRICLGVIPVGTGNDWIRTFGIPSDYESAIKVLQVGKTCFQNIGKICITRKKSKIRYFANMAGFGFDAMVTENANKLKIAGEKGLKVYIKSLFNSYLRYKSSRVTMVLDEYNKVEKSLFSASVGIGKFSGGGMMQVPSADPFGDEFHVTVIGKINLWTLIKNIPGLYNGKFISDSKVSCFKSKKITIKDNPGLLAEVDGENIAPGSFVIELMPKALHVVVGKDLHGLFC
jgi:YegS/Rv2252/BmrU family lipid kinase